MALGWMSSQLVPNKTPASQNATWAFVTPTRGVLVDGWHAGRGTPRPSYHVRWSPVDPLLVALLISFSALRYQVGSDYPMYLEYFERLDPRADWLAQIAYFQQDAGYTVFALIVKSVSAEPFAIFWATAFVTVLPVYFVVRRVSADIAFSLFLFVALAFYVSAFNGVRQGVAVSLLFWGYSFIGRRNWAFVVLALLAASFHASALIAGVVLVLARLWRPTVRSAVILIGGGTAVLLAIVSTPLAAEILGSLNERYVHYVDRADASGVGTYLNAAAFLVLAIYALANRKLVDDNGWLSAVLVAIVPFVLGTQVVELSRFFYYFGIFVILLIPNIVIKQAAPGVRRLAIAAGSTGYYIAYLLNFGDLIPYRTYL